jgi:hypothetical protein
MSNYNESSLSLSDNEERLEQQALNKKTNEMLKTLQQHIKNISKGSDTANVNELLTKLFDHYVKKDDLSTLETVVKELEKAKKFDIFKGNLQDFYKRVNIEAEQSDKQSEKPSDEPEYIQIIRDRLTQKRVSDDTMRMFNFLTNNENGKGQLKEIAPSARSNLFQTPRIYEQLIKQFYTNVGGPPLPQQSEPLSKPDMLRESAFKKLKQILGKYFNKERVLDKDCRWTFDCCTHVGEKINNLVEELKTFLTNLGYDLQTTTLAGIAPSLNGRYTVAEKDTSIFKYFIQKCFATDKKITLKQLESLKPQIQFLENFFGFEKTFFPTANSNDYRHIIPDPDFKEKTFFPTANSDDDVAAAAAADDDFNQNVMAAGRTHSRRKRHASKKSCKSHRRHRRSTHNKKRNTKRHMKRHTKRYRHRK